MTLVSKLLSFNAPLLEMDFTKDSTPVGRGSLILRKLT